MNLDELQAHLYSILEQPDAIPYVTSYYAPRWGFCLRHRDRLKLKEGTYHVRVDSTLAPGAMTFAELVLPGESPAEVLLSTYVCHPSMANNELSGVCVTAFLGKLLSEMPRRRYTYRVLFIPETIGSITYLATHLEHLRKHVIAGYVVTCVGDDKAYSYLPTRAGETLSDKVALHVLKHIDPDFKRFSFLDRGSDERQYNAPGVDLPIAQMMRTKYAEYSEYHTSLDDLSFISPAGLEGGYNALATAIRIIEHNRYPMVTTICEPQLGKRGLYPPVTEPGYYDSLKSMCDMIAYSDGTRSLLEIAEILGVPMPDLIPIYHRLLEKGVLREMAAPRR
jgi:aminopeptidase-like protein